MKETIIQIQLDENNELSVMFPTRENDKKVQSWEIIGLLETTIELVRKQYLSVKPA